jgi:hypothetical protein
MTTAVKTRVVLIAALALSGSVYAQNRLEDDLARYQHETDPVRKARILAKMGDAQVETARRELKEGHDEASLHAVEQYRDEVHETIAALNGMGVDPESKPAGFKELQISLRETVRHMDDLIFSLEVDKRPFFRAVRNDLLADQNALIDELFPRKPKDSPGKPESTAKPEP